MENNAVKTSFKFTSFLCVPLVCVVGLFVITGCATTVGSGGDQVAPEPDPSAEIKLECHSTYRHGCNYMGQVLPWNRWVEALGYSNQEYMITDIQTSGTMSKVFLKKR